MRAHTDRERLAIAEVFDAFILVHALGPGIANGEKVHRSRGRQSGHAGDELLGDLIRTVLIEFDGNQAIGCLPKDVDRVSCRWIWTILLFPFNVVEHGTEVVDERALEA